MAGPCLGEGVTILFINDAAVVRELEAQRKRREAKARFMQERSQARVRGWYNHTPHVTEGDLREI